jgi:tetratricopeptide (TPR) repeat protein
MRILSFHILFISILLSGLLPSHAVWAQTTVQTAAQTKLSHSLDGDTARIILLDNFNRYSARFVGNKLILQFDRPVSPTVKSSFFNDLKEYVVSIEPRPEENILQFTLSNPYFTIRKFKGNGFVGIDLVKQENPATSEPEAEEPTEEPATKTTKKTTEKPTPTPTPAAEAKTPSTEKPAEAAPAAPVSILPKNLRPKLKPQPVKPTAPLAAPAKNDAITSLVNNIVNNAGKKKPEEKTKEEVKKVPAPKRTSDTAKAKPEEKAKVAKEEKPKEVKETPTAKSAEKKAPAPAETKKTEAAPPAKNVAPTPGIGRLNMLESTVNPIVPNGARISFSWDERVGMAAFERAGHIWIIFDKPRIVPLDKLDFGPLIASVEQVKNRNYTILDLKHKTPENPPRVLVKKEDMTWSVSIEDAKIVPVANSIPVSAFIRNSIPRVFMNVIKTSEPLEMTDPYLGDDIVVIPLGVPNVGISPQRNYIDFKLPETFQGILIQPVSDGMTYKVVRNGVMVTSTAGLNIYANKQQKMITHADVSNLMQKPTQLKTILPFDPNAATALPKNFVEDLERLAPKSGGKEKEEASEEALDKPSKEAAALMEKEDDESRTPLHYFDPAFVENKRALIEEIVAAGADEKSEKRMKLAQFYFSREMYREAKAVLQQAAQEDLTLPNTRYYRTLLATLNMLNGSHIQAERLFRGLVNQMTKREGLEEVRLLRWANFNMIQPRPKTDEKFPFRYYVNLAGFLQDYPNNLRHEIGLIALEEHIKNGELRLANLIIEQLKINPARPDLKHAERFYQALIDAAEGGRDNAKALLASLTDQADDRFNRMRAHYELTKMQLVDGDITTNEAIEALNTLRHTWRGDQFEIDLLGLMGQLYINQGDYKNGLRTWKVLVSEFPRTQQALYTAGKMKKIFTQLFSKGGDVYDLTPVEALAVFFEFRELTPVGTPGDKIVRHLVDFFIEADLLENAAAVLTHQVRFRSRGEEHIDLALKLAGLHLQNNRPKLALEVLDFMKTDGISKEKALQRKYLKVRAFTATEDYEQALKLLGSENSLEARLLRADIFWKKEEWLELVNMLEPRIVEYTKSPFPLNGVKQKDVVLLAMAYSYLNEKKLLKGLRDSFDTKFLKNSRHRKVFDFITKGTDMVDYRRFTETVELESIGLFMTRHFFWPSKDWTSTINVLEHEVNKIEPGTPESPLLLEDKQLVTMLTTAYLMRGAKDDARDGRQLQLKFRDVVIDKEVGVIFQRLRKGRDYFNDADFEKPVGLRELETFLSSKSEAFKEEEE